MYSYSYTTTVRVRTTAETPAPSPTTAEARGVVRYGYRGRDGGGVQTADKLYHEQQASLARNRKHVHTSLAASPQRPSV